MPVFSKNSLDLLSKADPRLQKIALLAIQRIDFRVIETFRTRERQAEMVHKGLSKTMNSKHCDSPARAFDFVPCPFTEADWKRPDRFKAVADELLACARELGIKARWGGDWDQDGDWKDERFFDGPHFELME